MGYGPLGGEIVRPHRQEMRRQWRLRLLRQFGLSLTVHKRGSLSVLTFELAMSSFITALIHCRRYTCKMAVCFTTHTPVARATMRSTVAVQTGWEEYIGSRTRV